MQSSFTPFTCETVYQALKPSSPQSKSPSEDVRSIHFLPFPEVRQEYFDLVVERQVQRLKAVIDLGRAIRDKRTLPVKQPLLELVVFHHDQEYLDDVKSLESYVTGELNVVNVVYTSEEQSVGIQYRATADWPTLGKKLRKDMAKVKAALPKMTSEECRQFVLTGKTSVAGVELIQGDLVVTRFVEKGETETHESATDDNVIVLLDIRQHAELSSMALLRVLTSRVNKLRKESGLKATDKVDIFYTYDEGEEDALKSAVVGNEDSLLKAVGAVPIEAAQIGEGVKVLGEEKRVKGNEELGDGERFVLKITERA